MKYLYLILNVASLSVPFIYSFHPKLKFYALWKPLLISIVVTMLIFIPWDVVFTEHGIWGFNDKYFLGYELLGLPIEEWLFFICIPYACVFTHYALLYYFPNMELSPKITSIVFSIIILVLVFTIIFNYSKLYTFINFLYALAILVFVYFKNYNLLQKFMLTFLIMLIPFFIVNGILTGSFIDEPVVWYNDQENLDIRLATIPIEDTVYAFSLILSNLFVIQLIKK